MLKPAIAAAGTAAYADAHGAKSPSGGVEAPPSRIFLLGPTPLPMWTRIHGTEQVESRVFQSIHNALGVKCHRHANGGWGVSARGGVTPIDRYAIVGGRRRDAIHPFFNAQFAIVQTMLNHLCPAKYEHAEPIPLKR